MKHIDNLKAAGRDFLGGRFFPPGDGWVLRLEILAHQIAIFFEQLFGRGKKPEDGNWGFPPFAGKLVPVRPSPRPHLVAGRELPPSDATRLWRKR